MVKLNDHLSFFFLCACSVDSASGAFASNDEGAVMDTGGTVCLTAL